MDDWEARGERVPYREKSVKLTWISVIFTYESVMWISLKDHIKFVQYLIKISLNYLTKFLSNILCNYNTYKKEIFYF